MDRCDGIDDDNDDGIGCFRSGVFVLLAVVVGVLVWWILK